MAITVKTNGAANSALTQLNRTTRALSRNFERISSGLRIARSADDAAGLGVAEALKAAHHSSTVAGRNINDGISIIAVAEGSTNEVEAILIRMRELAIQSSSETLANTERAYIQEEFVALSAEVSRIANVTEFNGIILTNGSMTQMDVQVGINNTTNDQITINLGDLRATVLTIDTVSVSLATSTAALAAITNIDSAIASVSSIRSGFGATENRLNSALNNIETFTESTINAESRIRDADFGYETAQLTQNQILQQAGVSVLSQAKSLPQSALTLLQP
jgi:flagellin